MPPVSLHAGRRNWEAFEEFYNPQAFWSDVHLVSVGENDPGIRERCGSVFIHAVQDSKMDALGYTLNRRAFMRSDELTRQVLRIARDCNAALVAQRYGSPLKHGIPALNAAEALGVRSLITFQNDYAEQRRRECGFLGRLRRNVVERRMWRDVVMRPTIVWTVSRFLADYVCDRGRDRTRVVTISNKDTMARYSERPSAGQRAAVLQKLKLDSVAGNERIVLSVGRMIAQKNYARMLAAFARIAKEFERVHYVVVGQGPLEPSLRRLTKRLAIERRVTYVDDYLSAEELRILYHEAAVLLFVSLFEGQGRVALEAMAAGTPLIASRLGPLPEIVTDGVTGFLVDPDEVEGIAAAIRRTLSGELDDANTRRACFERAKAADLASINPMEVALYSDILNGKYDARVSDSE